MILSNQKPLNIYLEAFWFHDNLLNKLPESLILCSLFNYTSFYVKYERSLYKSYKYFRSVFLKKVWIPLIYLLHR